MKKFKQFLKDRDIVSVFLGVTLGIIVAGAAFAVAAAWLKPLICN